MLGAMIQDCLMIGGCIFAGAVAAHMRSGLALDKLEAVGKLREFGQTRSILTRFDQRNLIWGVIEAKR